MAAELMRNTTLILTRLSGWSRPRFALRLRRFAAHPPDIQAHARWTAGDQRRKVL